MQKVVVVGDAGVGKTSIIYSHMNRDIATTHPTAGMSENQFEIQTPTGKSRYAVMDTAGSEQYQSLTPYYLRDAAIAICVYDVTLSLTFENVDTWVALIRDVVPTAKLVLVGNKTDLRDHAVTTEQGSAKARQLSAAFFETSAKDGTNITELWTHCGTVIAGMTRVPKETLERAPGENRDWGSECSC